MKLETEARFDEMDDTYVSIGEVISDSGWAAEFFLAAEWVSIDFGEEGAQLQVGGEELLIHPGGEWQEGKLLGLLVRARLR